MPADVTWTPLSLRKLTHAAAALRLARLLRRRRVDILHSHLFYGSLFASPIGRLTRVPVIVETPHVREQWRQGWKARYFVDRLVGRFVDRYIAVSEANARYLAGEKGLPSEKIAVIRNGCDADRFDPARRAPAGLKASLGFGEDDPVLVMVGRLQPQKGHRIALHALSLVRRHYGAARLVCVGEGRLQVELQMEAARLGVAESVRFVGYQSRVEDWLALADLTILPSYYEGLPLAALESLAAGRPVVASAVDGTTEAVVDGKTGLTVPPGSPEHLARAICQLLAEPERRRAMGRAGRRWVHEHFTEREQVEKTQRLYLRSWEAATGRSSGRSRARVAAQALQP
jgi:glycosyltransferase involved in cell wall biosynthesis